MEKAIDKFTYYSADNNPIVYSKQEKLNSNFKKFTVYEPANPQKKFLKSDFVKGKFNEIPLCKKRNNNNTKCEKKGLATNSLISRKNGLYNNDLNIYFVLSLLKKYIDRIIPDTPGEGNSVEQEIIAPGIEGGSAELLLVGMIFGGFAIIVLFFVLLFSIFKIVAITELKKKGLNPMEGGFEEITKKEFNNLHITNNDNIKLNEIEDKVMKENYFKLKDNYYMKVIFSKDMFRTKVQVPFIIHVPNEEIIEKFNRKYIGKINRINRDYMSKYPSYFPKKLVNKKLEEFSKQYLST